MFKGSHPDCPPGNMHVKFRVYIFLPKCCVCMYEAQKSLFYCLCNKFQVVIITTRLQDQQSQRKHTLPCFILDEVVSTVFYLSKNDRHSRSSKVIDSEQELISSCFFVRTTQHRGVRHTIPGYDEVKSYIKR